MIMSYAQFASFSNLKIKCLVMWSVVGIKSMIVINVMFVFGTIQ